MRRGIPDQLDPGHVETENRSRLARIRRKRPGVAAPPPKGLFQFAFKLSRLLALGFSPVLMK